MGFQVIMTEDLLLPTEEYLKAGVHIGTKFKTKYMENFIYKTRGDGLSVLNVQKIDERLHLLVKFLTNYEPEDILVLSRRENGWKPTTLFSKSTGIKIINGRYPPGLLTNPNLETFIEVKLIIVTDAWLDRNAIEDAKKVGIPVVAFCDTNNQANNIDYVMPINNKGKKSLGLAFYVLAKEYAEQKKIVSKGKLPYTLEEFTSE